jgi:hypothetical protein
MQEKEYMQARVDDQISWYSKRSAASKAWLRVLEIIAILAAAAIPVVAQFLELSSISIAISVLGALAAAIGGCVALCEFRRHWLEYRTTAETLKHEKFMYLTKCGPYQEDNRFCQLVDRVESLVSEENSIWAETEAKEGRGSRCS